MPCTILGNPYIEVLHDLLTGKTGEDSKSSGSQIQSNAVLSSSSQVGFQPVCCVGQHLCLFWLVKDLVVQAIVDVHGPIYRGHLLVEYLACARAGQAIGSTVEKEHW